MFSRATFLGLPGELRNLVYQETFCHDDLRNILSLHTGQNERGIPERLRLLLVCRQIYHEAHSLAFQRTCFRIEGRKFYLMLQNVPELFLGLRPSSIQHLQILALCVPERSARYETVWTRHLGLGPFFAPGLLILRRLNLHKLILYAEWTRYSSSDGVVAENVLRAGAYCLSLKNILVLGVENAESAMSLGLYELREAFEKHYEKHSELNVGDAPINSPSALEKSFNQRTKLMRVRRMGYAEAKSRDQKTKINTLSTYNVTIASFKEAERIGLI